jgi:ribosomal protein S18 acetylase RimI-like enzyme
MKIINTTWEKRNLNVNSLEIKILNRENDNIFEIIKEIEKIIIENYNYYIVIKINYPNFYLFEQLSKLGFVFNELLHEISINLETFSLPLMYTLLCKKLDHEILDESQYNNVYTEIEKEIFDTDRIALNYKFGKTISAKRYINWLSDELNNNAEVFELKYKGKAIGFFSLKKILDNEEYDVFLAGLYNEYKNSGLGIGLTLKSIEELKIRKAKTLKTHVSSNNLPVLRLYMSLGFTINENCYVFTK